MAFDSWRSVVVQVSAILAMLAIAILHPETVSTAMAVFASLACASLARTRNAIPPGSTIYPPPSPLPPSPPGAPPDGGYRAPQASHTGFTPHP